MENKKENKIRGLIYRWYPTLTAFANDVDWTRQKASAIVNGIQEPSLDDIHIIAKATNEDADTIASIFLWMKTQICVCGEETK